jgi:muconolactone delta-isomerase
MKFLVCTWPNADRPTVPPSAEAFEAQTAWFRERLADGVIDSAHHADDRAVFIFNAPSRDALEALIAGIPLSDQMDRSIERLADFRAHTAGVAQKLRAAEAKTAGS